MHLPRWYDDGSTTIYKYAWTCLHRVQLHKTASVMQVFGCFQFLFTYLENFPRRFVLLRNLDMFNVLHDSQRDLKQIIVLNKLIVLLNAL